MEMKSKRIEGRAFIPVGVQCLPFKVGINSSRKTFDSLPVHIHYSKNHFNLNTLWRDFFSIFLTFPDVLCDTVNALMILINWIQSLKKRIRWVSNYQ